MALPDAHEVQSSGIERLLRRDRWIVALALALVTILAWAWLIRTGLPNKSMVTGSVMPGMAKAPAAMPSMPGYIATAFIMWLLMMIAMMLPSAAPMILVYARFARIARRDGAVLVPTMLFIGCYIATWAAFSLLAATAQAALVSSGLVSGAALAFADHRVAGALLVAAGLYNLTPLKQACLAGCRSPLSFLTQHWQGSREGIIRLGLLHGAYCLSCCWLLMALLFVSGVMNLSWVALLALIVAIEKLMPQGQKVACWMGAAMAMAGLAVMISAWR